MVCLRNICINTLHKGDDDDDDDDNNNNNNSVTFICVLTQKIEGQLHKQHKLHTVCASKT